MRVVSARRLMSRIIVLLMIDRPEVGYLKAPDALSNSK